MNDKAKIEWLNVRMEEVNDAFRNVDDEDKYHRLEDLEMAVQRVKAAVFADICITSKPYPKKKSPWFIPEDK